MSNFWKLVLILCGYPLLSAYVESQLHNNSNLLQKIHKERNFDSLLIVYDQNVETSKFQDLFESPIPKLIVTKEMPDFVYKKKFNAEILCVLIMQRSMDAKFLNLTSAILNYIRQTRILMLAENIENLEIFMRELRELCEIYKMTNVLLKVALEKNYQFVMLKPYPEYHWQAWNSGILYPQHWRNMQQKSLLTYTDQTPPRALLFRDPKTKELRLNGFIPRMVMLFAEHFNAKLEMYPEVVLGKPTHYTIINDRLEELQLDIPMVLDTGPEEKWLNMSYPLDVAQGIFMVPCAQPRTIREVFNILLGWNFFCSITICTVLLSLVHSLYDYAFLRHWRPTSFLLNEHILPGVLGQSFVARKTQLQGLKLVYFLLFFAGLNVSTQFSARVQTLFTHPTYHQQIENMEQLKQSPLKILLDAIEAQYILPHIEGLTSSLVITQNSTYFQDNRHRFNTKYGYYSSSTLWEMYRQKQQYFTHKVFCTSDGLTVFRLLPWGFRLQFNSPYQEPLNYLIHQVHAAGLIQAWHSSTFSDMLRLKWISIRDPNPERAAKVLVVQDFYWIWLIVAIGSGLGFLAFMFELICYKICAK
ncbi:uncharacterized protein LOC133330870 [Musca vetustissima]|uniref:uncharacterized protein LOC133330870 n=1 Tax=Musca vetustissima TaxID=27455 RepID=UPI002AB73912|nr:uncharacterized protein LOC133330870 [Musca vetustissima]